ncbi:PREDICTED: LOW QUALITY PROTEIN: Fc receptor-like protein 1 [Miniopterus natalensis]|uniref:LOW QUALITY PROTEIN: Fc receptor-like protein 1 n=1 Tax=Miniopterus natalensis TaxID=291302 RepID=UPI0007A71CD4|nr:PREDICTED: LOW QUALITY PROTEIN: Fc receptor-like protein 1 [Miniopterus natalensis]
MTTALRLKPGLAHSRSGPKAVTLLSPWGPQFPTERSASDVQGVPQGNIVVQLWSRFFQSPKILQVSYSVFERDNLRCQGKGNKKITKKAYNMDGGNIFPFPKTSSSTFSNASCMLLLTASSSRPIEGNSVILTCKIELPPQKLGVQLQFYLFKDGHALGLSQSNSLEFQITAVTRENSGSYWCEARRNGLKVLRSKNIWIHVRRIPVYNVTLETQPPGGHVMEGEKLVLVCLVTGGTGNITFFWYKGALGLNLEVKTQHSLRAKFEIPMVRESDAEKYYCAADNGYGPSLSGLVSVTVRIPVSRPVLTLKAPGAQNVVGDVVELHCEAWRGSPPILYRLYHEDVTLGNSSAPFGGGASFNLSLTKEHFGNYSCEASNGPGAQRSEVLLLNITGGRPARDPPRSPPSPVHRETTYLNSTAPGQPQPIYENVNVVSGNEVYSLVYYMQQERQAAAGESLTTQAESNAFSDIYSGVKKARVTDSDYEDTI